jgi:hypothetical protein
MEEIIMKNNKWFLGLTFALCLFTFALITGCGNATGGGSSGGGGGANMVKLSGHVNGINIASTGTHIYGALPKISKVVVFNCNGSFWTSDISSGAFTVNVNAGYPVGLVFSDEDNAFRGYLTMGSSVDSIPLNLIDSSVKELDLSNLFLGIGVATSENDLIDDKIASSEISNEDVLAMSFGNELFTIVIKNPDSDGNGEIDILETPAKYYRPYMLYFVRGGDYLSSPGGDGAKTPTVASSTLVDQYRFCLDAYNAGVSLPDTISVIDAGSTTRACSFDAGNSTNTRNRHLYYYSNVVDGTPEAGHYSVTGLSAPLTFEVSDKATATQYIAIAKPVVTVSGGNITQIDWTYQAGGSGSALTDPGSLVKTAAIQINGLSDNRIYDTQLILSPSDTSHTIQTRYILSGSSIPWNDVGDISMAYNDVFGNQVVVKWTK